MSDSWLQLVEEIGILYLNKVEIVRLLSVILNAIIKVLAKILRPGFFKFSQPKFNVFNSLVDDIL